MRKGTLVISLDFELYWSLEGRIPLERCRENILAIRFIVPMLLKLFEEYQIHATWATVGLMFFDNKEELMKGLPAKFPVRLIDNLGLNEEEDPFHYGLSLIKMINSYPGQEIGTHTFSHYKCLEDGGDKEAFRADLQAAKKVAQKYNLDLKSIVLPFNQVNDQYLPIYQEMGVKTYRGNLSLPKSSLFDRILRLSDAYISLTGHNAYFLNDFSHNYCVNIPSSRFLRPYLPMLSFFEPLRLRRILRSLDYAAKNGLVYHLWWHPRNFGFGDKIEKNKTFLKKILDHFLILKNKYGMESLNMLELTNKFLNK
jgi:peptidoglycan/xylan/chitin deacetylase (PgdA/CDA1 family)